MEFKHNGCSITIRFVKADRFGTDRYFICINLPMCQSLREYCFKKDIEEVKEYAKQLTECVRTVCG
jgi:hypothetical protein